MCEFLFEVHVYWLFEPNRPEVFLFRTWFSAKVFIDELRGHYHRVEGPLSHKCSLDERWW